MVIFDWAARLGMMNSLSGKELESVWIYPVTVHPAWVDALTPDITAIFACLHFSGGLILVIKPCEVKVYDNKYPSLGLEIVDAAKDKHFKERVKEIQTPKKEIAELAALLPQKIINVEESDPLKEGANSQISLLLENSKQINFIHIMPPITLGVTISDRQSTPDPAL